MGECSYCDNSVRKLTREHVFSDWFRRAAGPMASQTEGDSGRKSLGLNVVRDVCADCNNGPLSLLDAYAKSLYEKYFSDLQPASPFRFAGKRQVNPVFPSG